MWLKSGVKKMIDYKDIGFFSYGSYSSNNYGVNCLAFQNKNGIFYFSYSTLIAFKSYKTGNLYIIKNYWGTTTGKHLNWINPDKSIRLDEKEFNKALKKEGVL